MSNKPFCSEDHLHLVDGSGFIFRAYYALPPFKRSDGLPIGAVSGFCNMIFKMLENKGAIGSPTHLAVIFDNKKKTFRSEIFSDYKANRSPAPDDLVPQFSLIREATKMFGLPCIELEGYEADDIIATYALQASSAGAKVTIISSDKDLMQLVDNNVSMFDTMKDRRIGVAEVEEKFGVTPDKVVDVQSLSGDSVDNIPGATGIGIKTAAALIKEYGSLEKVLENASSIKQPKRRDTLLNEVEQIMMSKRLVELCSTVPLEMELDDFAVSLPVIANLLDFTRSMELRTLTERIQKRYGVSFTEKPVAADNGLREFNKTEAIGFKDNLVLSSPQTITSQEDFVYEAYETIDNMNVLNDWVDLIYETGFCAFDTETTSLDSMIAQLVGISLCVLPGKAAYIPLAHLEGSTDLFQKEVLAKGQVDLEKCLEKLKPVLEDPFILKIGQNIKYDKKVLLNYGIDIEPIDDTMLLSYALNGGLHNHGLDFLSEKYLTHKPVSLKNLLGRGKSAKTFDELTIDEASIYAAEDADITLRLWQNFKPQLHQSEVTVVYEALERPLVSILTKMERIGVLIDSEHLKTMSSQFSKKIKKLETKIMSLAGEQFNIASPKQLGNILFDKMGLPSGKKGKNGAFATGADVLESLASRGFSFADLILDWRQISKLKSTYTDALQDHVNPQTGRVHTSFNISGTATGRLSSTNPNLQNIPIRSEEGRRIREAFIAPKGSKIVSFDYSQIELRILAHIAEIDSLKKAFKDGVDIHSRTASEIFSVNLSEMTPDIRRKAKAINFGVIYGISAFGLANNLRISREEAKLFIETYFARYPGIQLYMDNIISYAKSNEYVKTLFGRRIHTPNINTKGLSSGFAKRAAINAPIQGTAADIIRRSMVRVQQKLNASKLSGKLLLQVHDELLFEVKEEELDDTVLLVTKVMESSYIPALKLDVPLVVEHGIGKNWAEAH